MNRYWFFSDGALVSHWILNITPKVSAALHFIEAERSSLTWLKDTQSEGDETGQLKPSSVMTPKPMSVQEPLSQMNFRSGPLNAYRICLLINFKTEHTMSKNELNFPSSWSRLVPPYRFPMLRKKIVLLSTYIKVCKSPWISDSPFWTYNLPNPTGLWILLYPHASGNTFSLPWYRAQLARSQPLLWVPSSLSDPSLWNSSMPLWNVAILLLSACLCIHLGLYTSGQVHRSVSSFMVALKLAVASESTAIFCFVLFSSGFLIRASDSMNLK